MYYDNINNKANESGLNEKNECELYLMNKNNNQYTLFMICTI